MQKSVRTRGSMMNRLWGLMTLVCLLGVVVCAIVNFAMEGALSWGLYPLGSIGLAWGVLTPMMLVQKNRLRAGLIALTVLIMPFLMLINSLDPAGGWAWSIGFPIAGVSLALLWLALLLLCYTKMNRWYALGIIVAASLCVNPAVDYVLGKQAGILGAGLTLQPLNVIVTLGLAAAFLVIGVMRRRAAR